MSQNGDDNPFDFGKLSDDTSENKAILYRLDERTERIDNRMERVDGRVEQQQELLDQHDDRIQRNTTILNAITFGIGSFVTAVMAKLNGLGFFK